MSLPTFLNRIDFNKFEFSGDGVPLPSKGREKELPGRRIPLCEWELTTHEFLTSITLPTKFLSTEQAPELFTILSTGGDL